MGGAVDGLIRELERAVGAALGLVGQTLAARPALLAALRFAWRRLRRWQHNRYRRKALQLLAALQARFESGDDSALLELAPLLRATALQASSRAVIAGASRIEGLTLNDQGCGLVNVPASWPVLRDLAASESAHQVLWYHVTTRCPFQDDGEASAAYWRVPGGAPNKTRTLFAYLLQAGEKGAHSERIGELLWPEGGSEQTKRARLHHTVTMLRKALGW